MTGRTRRILIRATVIGLQWVFLTVALGSLVMRADRSFDDLISPHLGAAPMFIGALVASFLLGLTVESPRYLAPLLILMCLVSSLFFGLLTYAPVIDGVLLRTTGLDNYVAQRVVLLTLILLMASVPGGVAGNLLGSRLNVRQEILPHPEDLAMAEEVPWWEHRHGSARKNHGPS